MKRALHEEDTTAARQREEEDDATARPATNKKPRGGPSRMEGEEEEGAEANFLSMLPYPALRRLLDYLLASSSDSSDKHEAKVLELCRLRVESVRLREELSQFMRGEGNLSHRPFYMPPSLVRWNPYGWQSGAAALRLTSHAIKDAVDHAIGAVGRKFIGLYAPFDGFLRSHLVQEGRALPLFSDSASAHKRKKEFSLMADLTLGTLGARLQQSRLNDAMEYVWKQWGFSQAKLAAFRRLITTHDDDKHPLLEIEYFRHGEDYLGQQYGTCGRSIVSIGLPEKPDEIVRIQLAFFLCWNDADRDVRPDPRWNLQLYLELYTGSLAWRDRLGLPRNKDHVRMDLLKSMEVCLALFDYNRSCGEMDMLPFVRKTVVNKLAGCLGMVDPSESPNKAGRDLLTILIACMGFVWKEDVSHLWDLNWDGSDHYDIKEEQPSEDTHAEQTQSFNGLLRYTNSLQRAGRWEKDSYLRELNNLLDNHGLTPTPENGPVFELLMERVSAYVANHRLSRAVSVIKSSRESPDLWTWYRCPEAFLRLAGIEIASEFRAIYARTLSLGGDQDYARLSDSTIALAYRFSSSHLRELLGHEESPEEGGDLHLVFIISDKSVNRNLHIGDCSNSVIALRLMGAHPRRAELFEKIKKPLDAKESEDDHAREPRDPRALSLTLNLNFEMGESMKRERDFLAAAQVGRLLGLWLQPRANPPETGIDEATLKQSEELEFGRAVIEFLFMTARSALWDADECAFPISIQEMDEAGSSYYQPVDIRYSIEEEYDPDWTGMTKEEVVRLILLSHRTVMEW